MNKRFWILTRALVALAAVGAAVGCGGDGDGPTGLDPNIFELTIVSGGGGSGIAGGIVTEPLVVRVRNRSTGAGLAGETVTWTASGASKATRAESATDPSGQASTLLELETMPGTTQVTASVAGLPSVTFASVTILPAPTIASLSAASADPGDTIEVRVNDLPSGFTPQVLFDGVEGALVGVQSGAPSVVSAVVPAPVGVCSATSDAVDVRVRVAGVTTVPAVLSVSVPANPFQVGQVLVIEAQNGSSGDVQCALLPAAAGTAKYLLVALSTEFETSGQFQVTLGANSVAMARAEGAPTPAAEKGFHASLRDFERRLIARGLPRTSAAPPGAAQLFGGPLDIGNQRQFWVINDQGATSGEVNEEDFDRVTATLRYVGAHTLFYTDDSAPSGGLTQAEIDKLGDIYDLVLYETDLDFFGDNSDVDGNGRVFVLLSPTVNGLTPPGSNGFVVGFFFGLDIFNPNTPNCPECRFSNGGEILYGVVPDPTGIHSDPRTKERVLELLPGVTVHETQHMIGFNWKVQVNNLFFLENLWLGEAEAHFAEEVGGDAADAAGEVELANDLYEANFGRLARYLAAPQDFSLTALDGSGELGERGAWWLFLRWIAEQHGDFILRGLTQAPQNGVDNIEKQTGESFFRLFADWSVAVWADDQDIPGLSDRYQIPKWDIRSIVLVVPEGGGDPEFPLKPVVMSFDDFRTNSITQSMAATSAFYVVLDAQNSLGDLQLELTASTDAGIAILRFE